MARNFFARCNFLIKSSKPAVKIPESIAVAPSIPAHSIIAVEGDGLKLEGDDGVVLDKISPRYEAVSELVVRAGRSVQKKPEAIEEIRRILLEPAAV